jgi:hypothetical protein
MIYKITAVRFRLMWIVASLPASGAHFDLEIID